MKEVGLTTLASFAVPPILAPAFGLRPTQMSLSLWTLSYVGNTV
jgi:hypothetical protein